MKLAGAHGRCGRGRAGSGRCNDALPQERFNPFQTFRGGVVVPPGDSDRADGHRPSNGNGGLPTGRLAGFRASTIRPTRSTATAST